MEGFEFSTKENAGITTMHLKGYLDAHTYPIFEEALQKLVDEGKYKIIVAFKDLAYISSAGLGVLMGFIETVRHERGDIKLCSMSAKVFKVFDLLGFPTIFDILEEEEQANSKFNDAEK